MTLIVVSGAPGTGKSTIAAALGAALRFPDTGAAGAAEGAVTEVRSVMS